MTKPQEFFFKLQHQCKAHLLAGSSKDPFTKRTTVEVGEHRATTHTTQASYASHAMRVQHARRVEPLLPLSPQHDSPPACTPTTWHASITHQVASSHCVPPPPPTPALYRASIDAAAASSHSSKTSPYLHAQPPCLPCSALMRRPASAFNRSRRMTTLVLTHQSESRSESSSSRGIR